MDRHIGGFVDAYYGPKAIAERVAAPPVMAPEHLVAEARALLGGDRRRRAARRPGAATTASDLPGRDRSRTRAGTPPGAISCAPRRSALTTARKLAGEPIAYADEVEACYGVRPRRFDEDEFEAAHRRLEEVVPGTGPLAERYVAWREAQAVPRRSARGGDRLARRGPSASARGSCSACPTASVSTSSS